jgi:molybdate transport system substrate-binding protein
MTWPRILLTLGLLTLIPALVWMMNSPVPESAPSHPTQPPLVVLCAASNRGVVEEIAQRYARDGGGQIQFQFGASQSLLATAEISRTGDLFLPADESYIEQARQKHLIGEAVPLARMRIVLAVPVGNPHGVKVLADLSRLQLKLAQGDPQSAAIGLITRSGLSTSGQWELLVPITAFRPTVIEALNDLKLGAADAAIAYDVLLRKQPELEAVPIPELVPLRAQIAVAVLKSSTHPEEAEAFVQYLTAPDQGRAVYAEHGFEVDDSAGTSHPETAEGKSSP